MVRKLVIASGVVALMTVPVMAQSGMGWYVMKGAAPSQATGDTQDCYAGKRESAAAAQGPGETLVGGPYRTQEGAEAALLQLVACPTSPSDR